MEKGERNVVEQGGSGRTGRLGRDAAARETGRLAGQGGRLGGGRVVGAGSGGLVGRGDWDGTWLDRGGARKVNGVWDGAWRRGHGGWRDR